MKRTQQLAVLLTLVASLLACGGGDGDSDTRWARRFLPFEEGWRPLSEVPVAPQESPMMVIWELSDYAPGVPPTPEQRRAAEDLIARSERAARENGWYDFQKGLADGYKLMFADRRHYANEAFVLDDRVLDPERPEFLMYYGTPQGKQLAGLMFYTRTPTEAGPQPGGPLTLWHYHVWANRNCLLQGMLLVGLPAADGQCERGVPMHRSPEMLHIWLVDHPLGPFSTSMYLEPRLMQELLERRERKWAAEGAAPAN